MPIISRGLSPILSERFLSFTRAYRSCRPLPIVGVIRSCAFHPLHLRTLPPLPFLPHPKSPNLAAPPAQAAAAAGNLAPIAPAASRTCVNVEPRGIARRPLEKLACRGAGGGGSDSFHRGRLSVLGVGQDDSPSSPFHLEASQTRRSRGREFTQPRKKRGKSPTAP